MPYSEILGRVSTTEQRGPAMAYYDDLNRASEQELRNAKANMQEIFDQHAIRPGDEGYVYDKQVPCFQVAQMLTLCKVEFHPTEANDWDEDDDD